MKTQKENKHLSDLKKGVQEGTVSRREFIRMSAILGISATSAYGMVGLTAPKLSADAHKKGNLLRIGTPLHELKDPASLDWPEVSNVTRMMFEYLTEVGSDNVVRPYLAERWEPNDDLTKWRFTLRKGVTFNNGDAFTVEHVKANFDRWTDKNSKSVNKSQFDHLEKFEAVNDYEFVLHLKKPDLSIPEKLYEYPTGMVHKDFDQKGANALTYPVGTGPCTLVSYKVGDKAVFEARDNYWGNEAGYKRFEFIDLGGDDQAYINALASKQVDIVHKISPNLIPLIKRLNHLQVFSAQTSQTSVVRMKVTKKPFDDIRVRKAIVRCADNAEILKIAMKNDGIVAENHHVAPSHPDYYKLPALKQNIAEAKKLLSEAGYDKGLEIECLVGNTQGNFEQDTLVVLKQQCAKAGITINIKVLPTQQYWPNWDKADFSLTFWANRPLGIMVLNLAYHSNAKWNETEYSNPKLDALLDKASGIVDPKERSMVMKDIEQIIQDDCIMVQPYWREIYTAGNKNLKGFELHPAQYLRYDRVYPA